MDNIDKRWDAAVTAARDLGASAGDGSDHECDLSGEWADRPAGPEVYQRILAEAGVTAYEDEWFSELLDAYEEAYNEAAAIGRYSDHRISLEYEQVNLGGFAYTNWLLFVDGRLFYLGQDAKFVTRVLGQDFAGFIREAFVRAGIDAPASRLLTADFNTNRLRASLAAGIVRGLDDIFSEQGQDFFELVASGELEPWSFGN